MLKRDIVELDEQNILLHKEDPFARFIYNIKSYKKSLKITSYNQP